MFSIKERFLNYSKGKSSYAPMTLGAPKYIYDVDYNVFRKTHKEKLQCSIMKAQYKKKNN